MRSLFAIAALVAVLPLRAIGSGPTSADYQAAIAEATERYRGDCIQLIPTDRQYFDGSVTRDLCEEYLAVFADFEFTRSLLQTATPNPAMQLTPSRTAFTFHHD